MSQRQICSYCGKEYCIGLYNRKSDLRQKMREEELCFDCAYWKDYIERLSGYMASTGKQYQNHAATIISWASQDHPASQQRNYESEEYETL